MLKFLRSVLIILILIYVFNSYNQYTKYKHINEYNEWEIENTIKNNESNYKILIDVEYCKLYLFEDNALKKEYPCAPGKWDTPSPIGTWKVINKDVWGGGFGGSWMGFNVPWGKFGIHGTRFPETIGTPASHGCIRMFNEDAKELYNTIPHGTKVIIKGGSYGPFGQGIRTLEPGKYGSDVFVIQKRLKELGYYYGPIDGIYGESMKAAVHKYQKKNGLYVSNYITRKMIEMLGFIEFE